MTVRLRQGSNSYEIWNTPSSCREQESLVRQCTPATIWEPTSGIQSAFTDIRSRDATDDLEQNTGETGKRGGQLHVDELERC